jgi:hypothetical protein
MFYLNAKRFKPQNNYSNLLGKLSVIEGVISLFFKVMASRRYEPI